MKINAYRRRAGSPRSRGKVMTHDQHVIEMQAGQAVNLLSVIAERYRLLGDIDTAEQIQALITQVTTTLKLT